MPRRLRSTTQTRLAPWILGLAAGLLPALPAAGQTNNPVYVDDSPRTETALHGVRDLAATGNLTEAVRILQQLLDEEGDRVIATAEDEDLFISVRERIHAELLANPELLDQYRRIEAPNAHRILSEGRLEEVERSHLLTDAGFEATLRLTQWLFESARFEAAWLMLRQLDMHPDRKGVSGDRARVMLRRVAEYIGLQDPDVPDELLRDEVWATLQRWTMEAGGAAIARSPASETPIEERFHAPWFDESLPDMEHLVAHPLPSVTFAELDDAFSSLSSRTASGIPRNAQFLYVMPAVAGDRVFLNDGSTISAWNRFTLNREWAVETRADENVHRARLSPSFDGTTSVTVEGPWVVGITGLNLRNFSGFEQYITAIETETGQVIWQTAADQLPDPALSDLAFRGPVLIDQRTVVIAGSKQSSQRGLESRYLVGLDLVTGDMEWARPLGSAGALRHGPRALEQDMPTSASGMTYYTDPVGFVAAVESWSGRVHWIRRLPPESNQFDTRDPWEGSMPLVVGDLIYTLTPDRRAIHAYERATGKRTAQISAAHFDAPQYILHADGHILGVNQHAIWSRPADDLDAPIETAVVTSVPEPGIRGRVVVAGDELVVPVANGLRIVRATNVDLEDYRHMSLDDPGNVLPVESGLIVVDDRQFHPYLVWEVAERILRDRMEARPGDATDAVTLAALAHRAGRSELIVPTVDRAIRAIDADPLSASSEKNRGRLFRSLLDMIEPPPSLATSVKLTDSLREQLLDRLGMTAALPLERVAHLMARGQFFETIGQPRQAIESYQTILGDDHLLGTSFTQFENTVSAEAEATRRLRRIIQAHGDAVYDVFDQEATRQFAEIRSGDDPAEFERLARQYPPASITPRAWLAAAARYRSLGRQLLAIHATEEALDSAADCVGAPDPPLGEIAGRLIRELLGAERYYLASRRLSEIRASHPGIQLTTDGRAMDVETTADELSARLTAMNRRPEIGPALGAPTVLTGWRPVEPASMSVEPPLTDHIVLESRDGEIALWKLEDGGLSRRWGGVSSDEVLLRLDETGAYFARALRPAQAEQNFTVIRRRIETGEIMWATLGFEEALLHNVAAPVHFNRRVQRFSTPLRMDVSPTQVMFDSDAQTVVLVERIGRAAAFDLETGELLWSRQSTMDRVHDAVLDSGTLLVGGANIDADGNLAIGSDLDGMTHLVMAIDARTGDTLFRREERDMVRWVSVTPETNGVVGVEDGAVAFDLFRGTELWRLENDAMARSKAAWTFPNRLLLINENDWLRQVDTREGVMREDALDARDRLDGAIPWVATRLLGDRVAIASLHGVMIFDAAGDVAGVSLPQASRSILPPAFSRDEIITIERDGERLDGELISAFTLNLYSNRSCKIISSTVLELGVSPDMVGVVDGAIVIGAGWVTATIPATHEVATP